LGGRLAWHYGGMTAPTRCSEALAELEHLLEPRVWVTDLHWEAGLVNVATVTGYVKMLGIPIDPLRGTAAGEHDPAEVRAALFSSAQVAIRAVEDAGWQFRKHPVLTIGGEMHWKDGVKVPEASATLTFVVRPPKREEAA
jgi:hypothetical protein